MPASGLFWAHQGPPQVWSSPPIHSTSKGLPSAHLLRSLPMLCSPRSPLSPTWGAHIFPGPRSHGGGGQVGGPGGGVGGRGRRCSVTSRQCPLGRGPGRGGGAPGGYFSIFYFQIFLYLNLQICIIQGQPIKEDYNDAPRDGGGVSGRGWCSGRAFPPESCPKTRGTITSES